MSNGDGTCPEGRPTWLAEPERAAGSTSQALEWAPFLPSVWRTERIKALARREKGAFTDGDWVETPYITDSGIRLIQTGNIGTGHFKEQGFRFISTESFKALGCTRVEPGDVLVCRLAAPVGRACLAPDLSTSMITSVDVCILKTRDDVDARYVVYTLSAQAFLDWVESTCRGSTRDRISRQMLGSMRLPLPLHSRQVLIADFLDRETEKIDALVAKKEHLIELLREKRTALIGHAVTKGLDPDAPMKDSGMAWFGAIPAHWPVVRLGHFAHVLNGSTPSRDNATYWIGGTVPWVTSTKVNEDRVTEPSELITEGALRENSLSLVPAGTVIIGLVGQGRTRGKAALLDIEATINQNTAAIIPRGRIVGRYLQYQLENMYTPIREYGRGANQAALNCEVVAALRLPLPPPDEQAAIARFLDGEAEATHALTHKTRKSIDLLMESRSALITGAVTGQIDVRKYAKEAS